VTPSITLLGPQRRPTLDRVLASLGVEGPVAVVNAGWRERESDDAEILGLAGEGAVNLRLFARWMDALQADPEYAAAEREHRLVLDELRQLYLIRLDHALQAESAVSARTAGRAHTLAMASADALEAVRLLDATHLARVGELHDDFYGTWRLEERGTIAAHREEVRGLLSTAQCLVVAGGHVGELIRVLHLGASLTEVFDAGIGVVSGLVLLPHARRRLLTDDVVRMSGLARRFAPAPCLVLDDGVRVDLGPDGAVPPDARVVGTNGLITGGTA
jgi:hypothetical protein